MLRTAAGDRHRLSSAGRGGPYVAIPLTWLVFGVTYISSKPAMGSVKNCGMVAEKTGGRVASFCDTMKKKNSKWPRSHGERPILAHNGWFSATISFKNRFFKLALWVILVAF